MKRNRVFLKAAVKAAGLLAVLLVYGLVLAGCDTGDNPDDEERPGIDLPAITEETTGRDSISGTAIPLEAGYNVTQTFVNSLNEGTEQNGVNWSVTNGKLTFSLGTPDQPAVLNAEMVRSLGDWTNVQVSPTDTRAYLVDGFEFYTEEANGNSWERIAYNVGRYKIETDEDEETYYRDSKIIYLYVSKDVTLSAQSGQDKDFIYTYTAFNLSLKAGWNLLQEDRTLNGGTMSVSIRIATKNVPWTVNEWWREDSAGPGEQTTGRASITGSNIPLEAGYDVTQTFVNSLNEGTDQNGITWSVTNGKLTFSLGTPSQTASLNAEMVGSSLGGWTNVQVSPPDAQAYPVDGFEFYTEETNDNRYNRIDYNVARYKVETDEKTYYRVSQIIYLYVSKDVTLSAQSGQNEGFIYTAFDLSLKAGWNLLQMDVGGDLTQPSGTLSIHIATKNVPWMVNVTGGSTNDSSEGEDSVKCISMLNAPSGFSTSAVVGIIPTGTSPSGIDDPAFVAGREFSITDTLDTVDGSTVTFYLYDSRYRNQNGVSIIPWTGTGVFDVYVATSATALSGKMFANVAITESVTPLDYNEGVNFDLRKPTVGDNRGARR